MISIILLAIVIILIVVGYITIVINFLYQNTLFQPLRKHIAEPSQAHSKLLIENRLSSWHFNNHPGAKTVLFCHGNYGNISHNMFLVDICHQQKLNLLIFDYSGYGKSKGNPDPDKACQDGEAAYNYLRSQIKSDNIILWGMSMGGAIATYVASRNPCHSLILMSTFSSVDDIPRDLGMGVLYSCFVTTIGFLVDTLQNKERIKTVRCPVVIMHSPEDEIIPFSNAQRLYDSIPHKCKELIVIGGGHVSPIISEKTLEQIFTFCCLDTSYCRKSKHDLFALRELGDYFLELEKNGFYR